MSGFTLFRRIVFPVAIRQALPAYGNEIILMVKSTSLASTITILEVTGIAKKIIAATFAPMEVFIIAGAIYLSINFVVTRGIQWIEMKLSPQLYRDRKAEKKPKVDVPARPAAAPAIRPPGGMRGKPNAPAPQPATTRKVDGPQPGVPVKAARPNGPARPKARSTASTSSASIWSMPAAPSPSSSSKESRAWTGSNRSQERPATPAGCSTETTSSHGLTRATRSLSSPYARPTSCSSSPAKCTPANSREL